jgi:hypothetical protein
MDRSKQISFTKLNRVLEKFGYSSHTIEGGRIIFSHAERSLLIVLSELQSDGTVRPIDLISVRNTLINDGVVRNEEEFQALFQISRKAIALSGLNHNPGGRSGSSPRRVKPATGW